MADEVQVPTNAPPEFVKKIQGVLAKAKASGDSMVGFGDFINTYWDQYQTENPMANPDEWMLADVDGDGVVEWVNKRTQEIKATGYGDSATGANDVNTFTGLEEQMSSASPEQSQGMQLSSVEQQMLEQPSIPDQQTEVMPSPQEMGTGIEEATVSSGPVQAQEGRVQGSARSMLDDLKEFDIAKSRDRGLSYEQFSKQKEVGKTQDVGVSNLDLNKFSIPNLQLTAPNNLQLSGLPQTNLSNLRF